jgi:hypothetical protein
VNSQKIVSKFSEKFEIICVLFMIISILKVLDEENSKYKVDLSTEDT